jgi:hypothetical protein
VVRGARESGLSCWHGGRSNVMLDPLFTCLQGLPVPSVLVPGMAVLSWHHAYGPCRTLHILACLGWGVLYSNRHTRPSFHSFRHYPCSTNMVCTSHTDIWQCFTAAGIKLMVSNPGSFQCWLSHVQFWLCLALAWSPASCAYTSATFMQGAHGTC